MVGFRWELLSVSAGALFFITTMWWLHMATYLLFGGNPDVR